jgi:CHAT domain-containing protein
LPTPDGGYLVEKHVLVSAPSAAVHARASAAAGTRRQDGRLLMVVNGATRSTGQETLRHAADEARSVSTLYRDVRVLADAEATRGAFLREAPRAALIHFAGHALSSEYRAEDTALVLAGSGGRMNAGDIARLPLARCTAVVLAACSTARGKVSRYEGSLSVARGFLAAGVPSVVATLWPIDDAGAAAFFPRVHAHLAAGLSPAAALRAAQLEDIRSNRSPALWAAVQVIGS